MRKDYYDGKEVKRYQMVRIQEPNWKKENKGMLKKIESYLAQAADQ